MNNQSLSMALELAVPLWIYRLKSKGGPTDEDILKCADVSRLIATKGDVLLFGGSAGSAGDIFNRLAEAIAILSFVPGGVRMFGTQWETKPEKTGANAEQTEGNREEKGSNGEA